MGWERGAGWQGVSYVGTTLTVNPGTMSDTSSVQAVMADMTLAAAFGSSTAATPAYGAAVMGNLLSTATLSATKNILAGVIGKADMTGTISSHYPAAAVIGEIGDKANGVKAAVLAAMGGDSPGTTTISGAMFAVSWWNSTVATAVDYGLDLEGASVTGYLATPRYGKAAVRIGGRFSNAGAIETTNDVCVLAGTASPTNGTSGTGAGNADSGSLYIRQAGASSMLYINTNTKASPTWTNLA